MRNLPKFTIALFALALPVLALPHPVYACSCIASTPGENYERADIVFVGTVKEMETEEPQDEFQLLNTTVTLNGIESLKGLKTDIGELQIKTADNSAACGVSFEQGTEYLVFATDIEGKYEANLCSGTARTIDPEAALTTVRELAGKPGNPSNPPVTGIGGDDSPAPADAVDLAEIKSAVAQIQQQTTLALAVGVVNFVGVIIAMILIAITRQRAQQ